MDAVAGFVLAGGQSRRMGRDKALLAWGSGTLVQHVAGIVRQAAGSVALLGDPARYGHLGLECIPDLRPGLGPLSGIETMLASGRALRNAVLACDVAGLDAAHLKRLLQNDARCVVTQDESGRVHPLCAVYDVSCLDRVQAALDENRLRLMDVVAEFKPAVVRYPGVLSNINTWEDVISARR